MTAYGVLSRGPDQRALAARMPRRPGDFRAHSPRFQGENVDRNLALVDALRAIAEAKGVSVAQVAIAWVAAQGRDIVPLVGARRRDRLDRGAGGAGGDA